MFVHLFDKSLCNALNIKTLEHSAIDKDLLKNFILLKTQELLFALFLT